MASGWERVLSAVSTLQEILVSEVRRRMEEMQVRQRDLATVVGISEKHLSFMLTGKSEGTLTMWDTLLKALS